MSNTNRRGFLKGLGVTIAGMSILTPRIAKAATRNFSVTAKKGKITNIDGTQLPANDNWQIKKV